MAGFGISLGLVKSVLTRGDGSVLKLKQHLKLVLLLEIVPNLKLT